MNKNHFQIQRIKTMIKLNLIKNGLFIVFSIQSGFTQTRDKNIKEVPIYNSINHCQLRYYYYPNLDAYFDTQKKIFYFKEKGDWKTAEQIPNGYRGYSMYNNYSLFITDYDDDNICQFINVHKKKYPYITNEKSRKLTVSNE